MKFEDFRSRHHKTLLLVVWSVAIFVASSIPGSVIPPSSLWSFDKLIHSAIFFVLGYLALGVSVFEGRLRNWSTVKIFVLSMTFSIAYAALDEIHQSFVPMRSADVYDFLADSAGIVAAHVFLMIRGVA